MLSPKNKNNIYVTQKSIQTANLVLSPKFRKKHKLDPDVFFRVHELGQSKCTYHDQWRIYNVF